MQWFQDEKIKHRMIGLAVLMSIALVFVPAMVKKSNQRLDRSMNLSLNVPPKPAFPKVEAVKPQTLFKSVKVARVVIPDVVDHQKTPVLARAESLSGQTMATRSVIQKTPTIPSSTMVAKADKPVQRVAVNTPVSSSRSVRNPPKPIARREEASAKASIVPQRRVALAQRTSLPALHSAKSDVFSVQVASFSRQDNALVLVRTLQQKGFKATYDKQGTQYRVLVGELGQRNAAKYLQQKLASATQNSGFIVKVG